MCLAELVVWAPIRGKRFRVFGTQLVQEGLVVTGFGGVDEALGFFQGHARCLRTTF